MNAETLDELRALRAKVAQLEKEKEQLQRALRPFADTVCSLRWLCADNGNDLLAHEEELREEGPTEDWPDLLHAHHILRPKCDQAACGKIAKLKGYDE